MNILFTEIQKKIKAHENYETLTSRSFEFDLFRSTSWFPVMNQWDHIIPDQNKTLDHRIQKNVINDAKLKVLFVGDTYNGEGEDLLAKMIAAMKLSATEFERLPLDSRLENVDPIELAQIYEDKPVYVQTFLDQINEKAPLFVISLGAVVTNILLNRREKMSAIHGKIYKLSSNNYEYQMMPLFHPDFLLINPNMKRTAWIDLQKIMELLGKN